MSVREHARLQSFPDWFAFQGPYTTGGQQRKLACPRFTQVGNAVPPLLAEALGEMLLSLLSAQRDNNSFHLSNRIDVKRKSSSDVGEVLSADFITAL
jgi:DNA (cytosine-5)-methyltransferase 1